MPKPMQQPTFQTLLFCPLLLLGLGLGMTACQKNYESTQESNEQAWVAKVGDKKLYREELFGVVPSRMSERDSIRVLNNYIEQWVRKQLLIQKAEDSRLVDNEDIRKRLQEYRNALLVHEFEKEYVEKHLEDSVTQEQLQDYYQSHQSDFELKENILKAIYIKMPSGLEVVPQLEKVLKQEPLQDLDSLRRICAEPSITYRIQNEDWVVFEQFVLNTPFREIDNEVDFLRSGIYFERSDGNFNYYLRILDYKLQDQVSPFSYIQERIRSIIIYKRKLNVLEQLEEDLYEQAQKTQSFEIRRLD